MKKTKLAVTPVALLLLSLTSCNLLSPKRNSVDVDGTIVIEPFANSSFGLSWIETMCSNWKKETGNSFNILVKKNSTSLGGTQLETINSSNTDLYLASDCSYNAGFYKGYFEDLTDLLDVKPDGDSGKTIKEKIYDYNEWEKISSIVKYDAPAENVENKYASEYFSYSGCYMLPYSSTFVGMLYNHDLFVENGLMEYAKNTDEVKAELTKQGIQFSAGANGRLYFVSSDHTTNFDEDDVILSAGRDGKYGTYDDGQPETMSKFDTMLGKIMAKGDKPFIYAESDEYITNLFYSYVIQKEGIDAYNALSKFNTNGKTIKLRDGTSTAIDYSNGYKAYAVDGIEEAANFFGKYFIDGNASTRYYQSKSTFGDARDAFTVDTVKNGKLEIAVDGNWYLKGASDLLLSSGISDPSKADFRMMTLPEIEGQKGIPGNEHGAYINAPEQGGIAIRKQKDPKKLEAIKSLITYILKDSTLSWITEETGMLLNYNYPMTDEALAKCSKFTRNCYEMFNDQENIKSLPYRIDSLAAPMRYTSGVNPAYLIPFGNYDNNSLIVQMKGGSKGNKIADMVESTYNSSTWKTVLSQMMTMLGAE